MQPLTSRVSGCWVLNRVAREGSQDNVGHSLREVRAEPLRYLGTSAPGRGDTSMKL